MHQDDTLPCFRAHMGLWAIAPFWLQQAVDAVKLGLWPIQQQAATMTRNQGKLYSQTTDGVAVVRIVDQITKGTTKFGGTSTVMTRMALRQALAADDITAVMLAIDSPGGQVSGVADLASDVKKASETKPVTAYIEDLGASAAYWIAAGAQRITANATAEIGSIGVFAVLQDLSGLAAREGVTVRVVSTGPYKGLGIPGTPVTQELVDEVQSHVDQIGTFFFQAVREGRRLSGERLGAVTDGRVWLAAQARELGLIDGVESFDAALEQTARMKPRRRYAAEQRQAQLRAARGSFL